MNPLLLNVPKLYYILISGSIPPAPHPLSSLWFFILKLVLLCIYFYLSIYLEIRSHYVALTGLWLPVWICLELTRERLASASQVRGLKVCHYACITFLLYVCAYVCRHVHAMVHRWRSKDNWLESLLSFHHGSSRGHTRVVSLGTSIFTHWLDSQDSFPFNLSVCLSSPPHTHTHAQEPYYVV